MIVAIERALEAGYAVSVLNPKHQLGCSSRQKGTGANSELVFARGMTYVVYLKCCRNIDFA